MEYFYTDTARVKRLAYDEETGEPVHDQMKVRYKKHGNFHVPKHFLRGTLCDEVDDVLANTVRHGAATDIPKKAPKKATPGYEREDYCEMDGVSSVSFVRRILLLLRNHKCCKMLIKCLK